MKTIFVCYFCKKLKRETERYSLKIVDYGEFKKVGGCRDCVIKLGYKTKGGFWSKVIKIFRKGVKYAIHR